MSAVTPRRTVDGTPEPSQNHHKRGPRTPWVQVFFGAVLLFGCGFGAGCFYSHHHDQGLELLRPQLKQLHPAELISVADHTRQKIHSDTTVDDSSSSSSSSSVALLQIQSSVSGPSPVRKRRNGQRRSNRSTSTSTSTVGSGGAADSRQYTPVFYDHDFAGTPVPDVYDVVMGVDTSASFHRMHRDAIRRTWMQYPSVYHSTLRPQATAVRALFVVGVRDLMRYADAASDVHWMDVAAENSWASVPDNTRVRFGMGSHWAEKSNVTGAIRASVAVFGDPMPGKRKVLQAWIPHARQVAQDTLSSVIQEAREHGDMLLLNCSDGNDDGKIYHWFRFAGKTFTKAAWVLKVDPESFVNVESLLTNHLAQQPHNTRSFWGFGDPYDLTNIHGDLFYGVPFMRGWAYGLTGDLAQWVARVSMPLHIANSGVFGEDMSTGTWLVWGNYTGEFVPVALKGNRTTSGTIRQYRPIPREAGGISINNTDWGVRDVTQFLWERTQHHVDEPVAIHLGTYAKPLVPLLMDLFWGIYPPPGVPAPTQESRNLSFAFITNVSLPYCNSPPDWGAWVCAPWKNYFSSLQCQNPIKPYTHHS